MHNWSTFGARTNHRQTRTHKIRHNLDLREATTFPHIVLFVLGHDACTQMSFCFGTPNLGVPKFLKLGLLWLWRPITFYVDLQLRWSLKKSCSPRQELSNIMWHGTCTQVNQGDSCILVIGTQISTLTHGPSFGHNIRVKYPNESCEPILDI